MTTRRIICKTMAKELNAYIKEHCEGVEADWKPSYIDTLLYRDRNDGWYLVIHGKTVPLKFYQKEDIEYTVKEIVWNSYYVDDILNW